jgi:hypothetical protein
MLRIVIETRPLLKLLQVVIVRAGSTVHSHREGSLVSVRKELDVPVREGDGHPFVKEPRAIDKCVSRRLHPKRIDVIPAGIEFFGEDEELGSMFHFSEFVHARFGSELMVKPEVVFTIQKCIDRKGA